MRPGEERNLVDVRLLKIIGLYQLLSDAAGPKSYHGMNAFGWAAAAEAVYMVASVSALIASIAYSAADVNVCAQYTIELLASAMAALNLCWLTRYSDTIWTCVQTTRTDCLSYGRHRTRTLESGRAELKFRSTAVGAIWSLTVVFWIVLPFVLWGQFIEVRFNDRGTRRYRTNVLNFVFPTTEESYDKYFAVYYLAESVTVIVCGHATLAFDVLVLSLCMAVLYQLRTVADSFVKLGASCERSAENDGVNKSIEESTLISDFKTLIEDQQTINNNIRNMYVAFRPVILLQVVNDSAITIILSSIIIMNYYNGMSLASFISLKFIGSSFVRTVHLFMICYLFTNVNEQMNSMNFALYSSEWTEKSLQYKNLLLHAMRMNSADNLKLKVTIKRIVNFELFARIMRMMYSILSVMVKWCSQIT